MLSALFDFLIGFFATRTASNTARTARNTAIAAERAAWTEAQKVAYQRRQERNAGEKRFVYAVFFALIAVIWIVGALTDGGH
jgi:hypothetical protein